MDRRKAKNREDPESVKTVRFSHPASEEFGEAVRWYEKRRPGWGGRLFDSVTHAIERIQEFPGIGAARPERLAIHQFRVLGFPYMIVYRVMEHDIVIVAVAHTSRRPGYWKDHRDPA